jgi:hypothetical protein
LKKSSKKQSSPPTDKKVEHFQPPPKEKKYRQTYLLLPMYASVYTSVYGSGNIFFPETKMSEREQEIFS